MSDPAQIFRSYDVRGVYPTDINEEISERIGRAYAEIMLARGDVFKRVVVAHDVRMCSPQLALAFMKGASELTGKIAFAGMLPLGAALFHAWKAGSELSYVTASHLPPEWGGIKFFHPNGSGWLEDENHALRDRFLYASADIASSGVPSVVETKHDKHPIATSTGLHDYLVIHKDGQISQPTPTLQKHERYTTIDSDAAVANYINHVTKVKPHRTLRIVVDCGNGAASTVAPRLFKLGGFEVRAMFSQPDGRFPNRSPDPQPNELAKLREAVRSEHASLGIAYDGDGDRMSVVDEQGNVLTPEQVAYIILKELLEKVQGPIVANVECTRIIDDIAKQFNRQLIRVPVGHTFLMDAVHTNKAAFGMEVSGHYAVPALVPFDDALAISYYLACVLSRQTKQLSEIVSEVPHRPFERINFVCDDDKKFSIISTLKQKLSRDYDNISDMDGLRIDFDDGWILFRASNTEPRIRLTVEANTQERFEMLKSQFSSLMQTELNTVYKPSVIAKLRALFGKK